MVVSTTVPPEIPVTAPTAHSPASCSRSRAADIVGVGAVTGYGWGTDALWDGLASGRTAVTNHAATAEALGQDRCYVAKVDDPEPDAGASLFTRALLAATGEAVTDATARGWKPHGGVGIVHCAVLGDIVELRDFYLTDAASRSRRQYLKLMPSTGVSMLMQHHGFHGPAMTVSAMCASGNAGLLTGLAWLQAGIVSDVIVAATDISATPEHIRQFRDLGVLIDDVPALDSCRPFQAGSRGFAGGEAAVAVILSASGTGSRYASLLGGAMSHDAHHVTNLEPSLTQIRRTVSDALAAAGVRGDDVAYLNAHGPGTAQCDAAEAAVSADAVPNAALYSLKPLVGHCQGAASLVEAIGALLAYDRGQVPAAPKVAEGDSRLLDGLTPVTDGPTLKTSIGLGGHNSAIVLAP